MPFTFSHPAAVLSFTYLPGRYFSLTGLVIGSMAPDFEYFIRMRVFSAYSHTWTGLFWFDLPLAILLAFIFHCIAREKLIDNLPHVLNIRLCVFKNFQWTKYIKDNYLVVIISCIVGIATHVLWDGFTHQHGQFVQNSSILRQSVTVAGYLIPVYKMLQYGSSLIGGLLIVNALLQLPSIKSSNCQHWKFRYWLSVFFIAFIVISIRL